MPMDSKQESIVWKTAIELAIENGFDIKKWYDRCDPLGAQIIESQCKQKSISFAEEAKKYISYTKMKAMAFSHDFALAFFPKTKCEDETCTFCKEQGGHETYMNHLKSMCEYENFACYLAKIMDEEGV